MEYLKIECNDCGREIESKKNRKYCNTCLEKRIKRRGSESSIKRMIRNREFIKDYKKNKQCEICGYNKYPEILAFHHRNKEDKDKTINTLMKTLKNLNIIQEEIDKCILLCPNCHFELHLLEKNKENEK